MMSFRSFVHLVHSHDFSEVLPHTNTLAMESVAHEALFLHPCNNASIPSNTIIFPGQKMVTKEITALEQKKLDLTISRIPKEAQEKWKQQGYINHFLLGKEAADGEVAWKT